MLRLLDVLSFRLLSQPIRMGNTTSTPFEACIADVLPREDYSFPGDIFFQETAVKAYNKDIPIVPAAVARPSTTEEVAQLVQCAVEYSVKVQPRGGGHSYANYCIGGEDGALVVDLEYFQRFEMDESTWYATVGGGTLLGELTKRMHDAGGRVIAHGTCPQVGIGGASSMNVCPYTISFKFVCRACYDWWAGTNVTLVGSCSRSRQGSRGGVGQ